MLMSEQQLDPVPEIWKQQGKEPLEQNNFKSLVV